MANAAGIIKKLNAALKKTNPTEFTIYKRSITRSGGDDLLGRPGTVDYTDVKIDPQPMYERFGRDRDGYRMPGAADEVSSAGTSALESNDYEVLFSPSAVSVAEVSDVNFMVVFKDSIGNAESFRVTDYATQAYQGSVITITAYLKSTSKQAAA